MIRFEEPLALLLALPWLVFWAGFARLQGRACRWIWSQVGECFRHRLTLYTPAGLRWQMGLLLALGLLLVAAAARPTVPGREPVRELTGQVVLVLDASASMRASDGSPTEVGSGERLDRFEEARELARELVQRLPGWRFALITFSGVATLQVPMTGDAALLEEALRVVELHNFYRTTGSSFGRALDRLLPFAEAEEGLLQAVLLSDGEQPFAESYREPLAALAAQGVPVHAAACGSEEGQTRLIFDFEDVIAGKTEKRVLREYTTRRVDEHLKRIARATGGTFTVAGAGAAETLAAALTRRQETTESTSREGRRDLAADLLGFVLLAFLFDTLVLGRPPRGLGGSPETFDLSRLGGPGPRDRVRGSGFPSSAGSSRDKSPGGSGGRRGTARTERNSTPEGGAKRLSTAHSGAPPASRGEPAVALTSEHQEVQVDGQATPTLWAAVPATGLAAALLAVAGCQMESPLQQASRQNEAGIAADASELWAAARTHYERSLSFGELAQIPSHNLARSLTLQGHFSEAHELYQRALELEPELAAAHYNDGWALFGWGEAERDPRGCQLERSRELWTAARERFAGAAELYEPGSAGEERSRRNHRFVTERLGEIEEQIADPPPECAEEPPPPEDGSGGAGDGTAGGGGGDGRAEDQEDREDQGGQGDPSSSGAAAPLSPQEQGQIAQALERLAGQGREEGKFHRRTREEQVPSESWRNPDREIWW